MAQHESKNCPRCNALFECKVGTILQCQCSDIHFDRTELEYLKLNYDDCLCRNCLELIKEIAKAEKNAQ